jgi:hypothetical protein
LCSGGLDVGVLTFERVNAYLAQRRVEGYSSFCSRASLQQLLDLLARCAAPLVEPMLPGSEVDALLAGFAGHLRQDRGWAARRRPRMCCGHGALSSDLARAPIWPSWAAAM